MDNILVIGASGLLGTRLMKIGKTNYQIFGTYKTNKLKGANFFPLDVTKQHDVFNLVEKFKPDLVIDTHSITNVDYCELNPEEAWHVNAEGTKNVAEACKTFESKMIFVSTDYVFDGRKSSYSEKDKPRPLNYYGKTKLISEKIIETLDVNHIIVRSAVLYGVNGLGKTPFILWILENLKAGKEINIVIDQFNNPTLSDNLAEILFKLYEKDASGLFHVVGKDNISRYELALNAAEFFDLDKSLIKQITTPELRQAAIRPRKLELSTKKLQRFLGIVPFGVEDGLKVVKEQLMSK